MCYGPDGRRIAVRFPAKAEDISLLHSVQTGYEAHIASYSAGTGSTFFGS
jgi:hypothetical protein